METMFGERFDINLSLCIVSMTSTGLEVLIRKGLDVKVKRVFVDLEGQLVLLDVGGSHRSVFRL